MSDEVAVRLRRLRQQIAAFRKLHDDELQLILEELDAFVTDLDESAASGTAPTEALPSATADVTAADPGAASPKRAKWLAEQERRAHLTRRDLLRGRGDPAS